MDGNGKGRGGEDRRWGENEKRNRYALGQLGHTHGELVDFIYWFSTISFWFFF